MTTKQIHVGALIEIPARPPWRKEPALLYVELIQEGKVIFRGGPGSTAPSKRGRWWLPYAYVRENGKLIRAATTQLREDAADAPDSTP